MKQKKWFFMVLISFCMTLFWGMTVFAAGWKKGAGENQNRWWYDYENGTYARDGWEWLDGNQDGVAECYYFDSEGWMAAGTITPDGYEVDENGAWIEQGRVMTKMVPVQRVSETQGSNQLIVYFSRTGTTERAAEKIRELTGADLVKLETVESYPTSYEQVLTKAQSEKAVQARPAIRTSIEHMEQYDTIYVGYPIWYGTAPMPVFTFLESYDLSGKTIVPFCTSGSSGISESIRDIRRSCLNSTVTEGRRVNDTGIISGWLSGIGVIH